MTIEQLKSHDCMDVLASFTKLSSSSSTPGPTRNKLSTSLEELFDPFFASSENVNFEDNQKVEIVQGKVVLPNDNVASESKQTTNEKQENLLECPVCTEKFKADVIEQHVNICLNDEPAVKEEISPLNMSASAPVMSDDEENEAMAAPAPADAEQHNDDINFVADQDRHFQLWLARRRQEDDDRRMAEALLNDKAAAAPAGEQSAVLARRLQDEESAAAVFDDENEEASVRLARQLQKEEEEAKKRIDEAAAASAAAAKRLQEEEQAKAEAKAAADAMLAEEAANAAAIRVAEATLLADERAALQRERQALADEAVARRLQAEEDAEEQKIKLAREVAEARRLEAQRVEARLRREQESLEQQLADIHLGQRGVVSLAGVVYPNLWSAMDHDENHRLVNLPRGCAEWHSVVRNFKRGAPRATVTQIVRNQNRSLWTWFYLRREEMALKNNGYINERMLYHGSRNDATMIICREGFDARVANLNGAIGAGTYFATSSSTSLGYLPRNRNGVKAMLVCRVVLGRVGEGKRGLRRPPTGHNGKLLDSVGSEQSGMYCVFDNHQCIPEYIIYFR